ncbi:hypothetical protein [Gloeomargarita lithophora]|uniref:hypothetical protein n=1 Tax=Gloeomargarita lithophora TaxID=1188228 RepID=UPI0012FD0B4A|nr:hypothetical protein [Gloeomargarita lithophora]
MTTVVCPLSGVLLRDQPLRENILQELLLAENIAPRQQHSWYRGGSDREFLREIWHSYRRSVSEHYLTQLTQKYHTQCQQKLTHISPLPWYPTTQAFLQQAQEQGYQLGLQTEQNGQELLNLMNAEIPWSFSVTDYGDLADPEATLVLESTLLGIQRARAVGSWVVGVAQQMPYHWVQRHAHWAVDSLAEWDWEQFRTALSAQA